MSETLIWLLIGGVLIAPAIGWTILMFILIAIAKGKPK